MNAQHDIGRSRWVRFEADGALSVGLTPLDCPLAIVPSECVPRLRDVLCQGAEWSEVGLFADGRIAFVFDDGTVEASLQDPTVRCTNPAEVRRMGLHLLGLAACMEAAR